MSSYSHVMSYTDQMRSENIDDDDEKSTVMRHWELVSERGIPRGLPPHAFLEYHHHQMYTNSTSGRVELTLHAFLEYHVHHHRLHGQLVLGHWWSQVGDPLVHIAILSFSGQSLLHDGSIMVMAALLWSKIYLVQQSRLSSTQWVDTLPCYATTDQIANISRVPQSTGA